MDEYAIEIVSLTEKDGVMSSRGIVRTLVLHQRVKEELTLHPDTVVINIACGLDRRCYRTKGLYSHWINDVSYRGRG